MLNIIMLIHPVDAIKHWQMAGAPAGYLFLFFNIVHTGVPTVVLIDGGGYKPAAMKWLKDQVNPKGALIGVWTMAEFQTKINNGFLG